MAGLILQVMNEEDIMNEEYYKCVIGHMLLTIAINDLTSSP